MPYDHIWMSCCYLHQRRINLFQFPKPGRANSREPAQNPSPTGPELVESWSRTFPKLELFQNWSQTSPEPVNTDSGPTQNRSRTGPNPIQSPGRPHSESDSSGAVSSKIGLFRRLAAAARARCSSSMCAFLWREKLDECMKVLLQAAQV